MVVSMGCLCRVSAAVRRWALIVVNGAGGHPRPDAAAADDRLAGSAIAAAEPPMPGFVDDAVGVAARVAEREPVPGRVLRQPGERRGGLERFLGRRFARHAD